MEPADSFYRYNLSTRKQSCGFGDYFTVVCFYCSAFAVSEVDFRPTGGTGNRLGVETPVADIGVLGGAFIAHLKNRHCGIVPVVRNAFDYRVSRPTVRADYKRITTAKIVFISHLLKAVPADGYIGGYLRQGRAVRVAGVDSEYVFVFDDGDVDGLAAFYLCSGGGVGALQPGKKVLDFVGFALEFNRNASGVVIDEAAKAQPRGYLIHSRTEANALHTTGYKYSLSFNQNFNP